MFCQQFPTAISASQAEANPGDERTLMFGTQGWIGGLAKGFFGEEPRHHIDRHSNILSMAATIVAHAVTPGNRIAQAGKREGATRLLKPADLADEKTFDGRAMIRAIEKEAERNKYHEPITEISRRIAADWYLQHISMMNLKPETLAEDADHILMDIAYNYEDQERSDSARGALGMYSEFTDPVNRSWAMDFTFNKIMSHEVIGSRIDNYANGAEEVIAAFDPFEIKVDVGLPINATCRLAKRTQLAQSGSFKEAGFLEASAKAFRATRTLMVSDGIDEFDMRYIQALVVVLMQRNEAMANLTAGRIAVIILSIGNMVREAREAQKSKVPSEARAGQELETALTSCDIDQLKVSEIRNIYRQISETRNVSMRQGMLLIDALGKADQDWEIAHMEPVSHLRLVAS